jgi:hypothetical protein
MMFGTMVASLLDSDGILGLLCFTRMRSKIICGYFHSVMYVVALSLFQKIINVFGTNPNELICIRVEFQRIDDLICKLD